MRQGATFTKLVLVLTLAVGVLPTARPIGAARGAAVSTNRVIALLARSGIEVYESPTAKRPVRGVSGEASPVRFLRAQVENLAREASSGGGTLGAELDALAPLPEGAPPLSYLLAGYVKDGRTPGAKAARAIMGRQPWRFAPALAFPSVVHALFVADVVRESAPPGAPSTSASTAPSGAFSGPVGGRSTAAGGVGGLCSALASFTNGALNAIWDALTVDNPNPANVLALAWNSAVGFIRSAGGTVLEALAAPFLGPIRTAVGILAAVDTVVGLLKDWSVTITSDPAANRFAIGNEPDREGEFTATVHAPSVLSWAQPLKACADLVNVPLPQPKAQGAPIEWQLIQGDDFTSTLITETSHDVTIGGDATATYEYVTGRETQQEADDGQLLEDYAWVTPKVTRTDVQALAGMVKTLVLGEVPGILEPLVNPALEAALTPLTNQLAGLVESQSGHVATLIEHHRLFPCDYPDATIEPCLVGKWKSTALQFPIPGAEVGGGAGAVMTIEQNGKVTIDYDPSLEAVIFIPAVGVGGTAKLQGTASAVITTASTESSETSDPLGQITQVGSANVAGASATITGLGAAQTLSFSNLGPAFFTGSYSMVDLLGLPVQEGKNPILTLNTSGLISTWKRVAS